MKAATEAAQKEAGRAREEAREEVAKLDGELESVIRQNSKLLAVSKEPILKVGK